MTRFDTERLLMRPLSAGDVDDLVALDADAEVMRFINGGQPTPQADIEELVLATAGHRWSARSTDADQFVGWFGLRPSADGEREVGYRLRRSMWGRGLATEGVRALLEVAFQELGAHRVWAQTMTANHRSRRVMERSGLRFVRTFHLDWPDPIEGTELGDVEYEVARADWAAGLRGPPSARAAGLRGPPSAPNHLRR